MVGGLHPHPVGLADLPAPGGDRGADGGGAGQDRPVAGVQAHFERQLPGLAAAARQEGGFGGPQQAQALRVAAGGEGGGALEDRVLHGVPAAAAQALRGGFERGGHRLVGAGRGGGEVEGAAVVVLAQQLGDGPVRLDAPVARRAPVGGGADERVAEFEAALVESDQVVGLRRGQVRQARAELPGGGQDGAGVAGVGGGDDQQQCAGGLGEAFDAVAERLREAGGRGAAAAGPVGGRARGGLVRRQFEQGERVAFGGGEEALPGVEGEAGEPFTEQLRGGLVVERAEDELVEAGRGEVGGVAVADGEQHRDRFGRQAPGDEQQDVGRVGVEPVGVVHDAQDRSHRRRLGEEAEHRDADGEAVLARALLVLGRGGQAQDHAQHALVGRGERAEVAVGQGPQERLEPGEGPGVLAFDADAAEHGEVGGGLGGGADERGFADPGLSAHDQGRSACGARVVEQ